jgi:hypothetical protein
MPSFQQSCEFMVEELALNEAAEESGLLRWAQGSWFSGGAQVVDRYRQDKWFAQGLPARWCEVLSDWEFNLKSR